MKKVILLLLGLFLFSSFSFASNQSLSDAVKNSSIYQKYKNGGMQSAQNEYKNLKENGTIQEIDFLFMLQLNSQQKQMHRVISTAKEGLEKFPNSAPIYTTLGMAYSEIKEYDKSIEYLSQSIKIKPSEPAYYNRGQIYYYVKKDYSKAISDFTNALNYIEEYSNENLKNKALGDIYYSRALCFGKKNNFNQAIEDYTEAIKYDNKNPDLYYNRAVAKLSKANKSSGKMLNELTASANKDFDMALDGYQKSNNKTMCNKIQNYKQLQAVMSVIK